MTYLYKKFKRSYKLLELNYLANLLVEKILTEKVLYSYISAKITTIKLEK